jgi:sugar phosphate permease
METTLPASGDAIAAPTVLDTAVSKVKWRMLPLFVVMFIANYIDRVNIGFVRPHLSADLGIGAAAFGFGAGLFFIGYALFEVPSNMMLQRFGAKAWLTRIMFTWGDRGHRDGLRAGREVVLSAALPARRGRSGLLPGRGVLLHALAAARRTRQGDGGVPERLGGGVDPVRPVLRRLLQVEGGGLHGWQWMFIIEGMFSVLLCFAVWFLLDSKPGDAKWLSEAECNALESEIAAEQKERDASQSGHVAPGGCCAIRRSCCSASIYFLISVTIYGATFWLPTIIKQMGSFTEFQVGLFNSIPWIISIAAMYAFAALAARYRNQQGWAAAAFTVAASACSLRPCDRESGVSFVAICFAAIGFKAASSLFWPIPQSYLDVRIAAGVIALINSLGKSRRLRGAGGLRLSSKSVPDRSRAACTHWPSPR